MAKRSIFVKPGSHFLKILVMPGVYLAGISSGYPPGIRRGGRGKKGKKVAPDLGLLLLGIFFPKYFCSFFKRILKKIIFLKLFLNIWEIFGKFVFL